MLLLLTVRTKRVRCSFGLEWYD